MSQPIALRSLNITGDETMTGIQQSLADIEQKIDAEITAKQKTIDLQEREIERLHKLMEEKNGFMMQMNEKLVTCEKNIEGNRQLINKLLNDIDRLNHDIEWYKRRYEKRSLLGVLKEKLLRIAKK